MTRRMAEGPMPEKEVMHSMAMATMRDGSGAKPCSKES